MREISLQTDPQEMVRAYTARMRTIRHLSRLVSLSRRGLDLPRFLLVKRQLGERECWKIGRTI